MSRQTTRRTFLKQAAAAATGPLILPSLSFAAPPSGRLQHASIGVSGMGGSDLGQISSHDNVDIVALCDIDQAKLYEAAKRFPKARLYRDWRDMLEAEEKSIDSVNVSTPDHMHAAAAMTAIRQGKHVYCQKPLTHEVYEARQVARAAHDKGVTTQMGIQIHAHDFYRTAVIWLQEGAIGKVKEWHSWCSASYSVPGGQRPAGADPIPSTVDWDLWLGTAPVRPYKEGVYHPFEWRRWRDFGSGATGDFGCHIFDPVFTALNIGAPLTITGEAESYYDEVWPAWAVFHYEFPGTALTAGNTIKASWSDGGKQPDKALSPHLPAGYELPKSGSLLIGEEGSLVIPHIGAPELHPMDQFTNYPTPELEPKNHYYEWVDACLGKGTTGAGFDFSGPLTETVLLGNVANRFPGETLRWNAKDLHFENHAAADALLKRNYRKGWDVRGL